MNKSERFDHFCSSNWVHQRYVQLKKTRKHLYTKTIEGDSREIVRTLGIGSRHRAEKRQEILDQRVKSGADPFSQAFDWDYMPKRTWWTIDECFDDFLETKEKFRYYTYRSYEEVIDNWIRYQNLSGKLIKSITKDHFEDFLMRDGIKNVSKHSEKRKLKTFWLWCLKEERVQENLISDIELPQKHIQ